MKSLEQRSPRVAEPSRLWGPEEEQSRDGSATFPAWRWTTLGEIAEIVGGVTKSQKRRPGAGLRRVPYLRVANVQRGFLDLSEIREIEATDAEIATLTLKPGDILFNEGGDRDKLGRGWVWNGEVAECIHQNHVFRARLRDPAQEPKFISWYANSVGQKYFFDEGKQTTNLASINRTKLSALPIPLPPPDEQRRIVAEIEQQFTRLDAGVAALRRAKANLKRYRAAVLKAACEGRLVPTEAELARSEGREGDLESGWALLTRILGERRRNRKGLGRYKEPVAAATSKLGLLPEGWVWASLDQLLIYLRNGWGLKPDAESGTPILRISAVRPLSVNLHDVRYLSGPPDNYTEYLLAERDLLFTRYNGNANLTGVCGVVPPLARATVHPDKLIRVQLVPTLCVPFFVGIVANVGASREFLAARARTTAGQTGIAGSDLRAIPIPLPPLAEQTRIVAEVERRLSLVDEQDGLVSANLQRATRLRQSILRNAFEGASACGALP